MSTIVFRPQCVNNNPALVQVMAWHPTGARSLPESVITQFIDAFVSHQALVNKPIEAETKRMQFHRQHFQMQVLEWKCMDSD